MSGFAPPVPGKVSSGSASARENFRAQEATHEALRVQPQLAVVDIESWGNFPLTVATQMPHILGAVPLAAFEYGNEGATVGYGSLEWAHGTEPGDLELRSVEGLTAGTHYTIRLLVVGAGG